MERERTEIGFKERLFISVPKEVRGPILRRGIKNILKNATYENLEESQTELEKLVKDGCAVAIVANHTSHADAFPAAKVGHDIAQRVNKDASEEQRINGYLMPFALSMQFGTQGRFLDILFNDSLPILEKFKTKPVFTATANDISAERVEKSNTDDFMQNMRLGVREGKGIIVFPEGRVEGGRKDENGNRKGLQEFTPGALYIALRLATMKKEKVAVVPVGISGGYNIYDPHRKSLPIDTFFVGLGVSSKKITEVNIGKPIIFEKQTLRQISSDSLDSIVGIAIANLLPEHERGKVYREAPAY